MILHSVTLFVCLTVLHFVHFLTFIIIIFCNCCWCDDSFLGTQSTILFQMFTDMRRTCLCYIFMCFFS